MKLIDFIKEIGVPEFKSIIGNFKIKQRNIYGTKIILLVIILFLSLLALGIAKGSLNYLTTKMEDPYVNFIDIPNPVFNESAKVDINKIDLEDQIKEKNFNSFLNPSVIENREKTIRFVQNNNEINKSGFILETDNIFYERIVEPKSDSSENMLISRNRFHNDSWGIIVTERFLEDLDMDISTPYVNISHGKNDSDQSNIFPVPIAGVVKQLRRKQEFILGDKLYYLLAKRKGKIKEILTDDNQGYIRYFIAGYETIPDTLRKLGFSEQFKSSKSSISHVKGMIIESSNIENEIPTSFLVGVDSLNSTRIYNLDAIDLNLQKESIDPECYTVLFNDLEKVAIFDKFILNRYGIELEKSTIEDKKNFSFFYNLSRLLSISIILFSIISIAFFTLNLLFSHINKNKRNLGTLKAFGLPNSNIVVLYSLITLLLVSISFAVAYSLSRLLGQSFLNLYISYNGIDAANYISNVVFVNYPLKDLLGFMVVVPTVCILIGLYLKLYKVTPGDLIYERK